MALVGLATLYAWSASKVLPVDHPLLAGFDRLMWVLAISLGGAALIHGLALILRRSSKRVAVLGFAADYLILAATNAVSPALMMPSLAIIPALSIVNGVRYDLDAMRYSIFTGFLLCCGALVIPYYVANPTIFILIALLTIVSPAWMYLLVSKLRRTASEARSASDAKTRFLAHMGHDLRTPLNAIASLSESVLRAGQPLTPDELTMLRDNARLLRSSVSDVLNFSRIEKGDLVLAPEAVNIRSTVERAISAASYLAHTKGLALASSLDSGVPSHVFVDPSRLDQILSNLIANSLRYTNSGRVDLHVSYDPTDDTIHIEVSDTGIGVPDTVNRLFEPFSQAEAGPSRRYDGFGLGLSIVRGLLFAMGGWITLKNRTDSPGTVASFFFPAATARIPHRPSSPLTLEAVFDKHRSDVSAKRILVVEDTMASRYVMCQILSRAGHHCIEAFNVQEAVAKLNMDSVDLAVVDLHMPGESGIDLITYIRSSSSDFSAIPILVVTADATTDSASQAMLAGAFAVLPKPVDPRALLDAIQWQEPTTP
jgi:two-component system sensor histidine kinase RpfC